MGSEKEELPEYQIFHALRRGEQESIGPFSQNQLVEMLNADEIKPSDFVYYPELTDWKPLSEVFDLHQKVSSHGEEGQDPQIVGDSFAFVDKRLVENEEVYYIAVQDFPALSLTVSVKLRYPKSVVLTNWRFFIIKPKLIGDFEYEEFLISDIERTAVDYDEGDDDGVFRIVPRFGDEGEVDQIPADQLARLKEVSADLIGAVPKQA